MNSTSDRSIKQERAVNERNSTGMPFFSCFFSRSIRINRWIFRSSCAHARFVAISLFTRDADSSTTTHFSCGIIFRNIFRASRICFDAFITFMDWARCFCTIVIYMKMFDATHSESICNKYVHIRVTTLCTQIKQLDRLAMRWTVRKYVATYSVRTHLFVGSCTSSN